MFTISIQQKGFKAISDDHEYLTKSKKFFQGDIIDFNENIISSSIRNSLLAGIVKPSKTSFTNKDKSKSTYLLVPLNKDLPNFQIELKKIRDKKDRYVLFTFLSWSNIIPLAKLHENLGPIENYDQFIDKILITNNNLKHLDKIIEIKQYEQIPNQEYIDYTHLNTFSIDPPNTEDIDDAFSFFQDKKTNNKVLIISITDVTVFLNKDLFDQAVLLGSSLYGKKRYDIFPETFLKLTSLFEGEERYTISLYLEFDSEYNLIKEEFINAKIINKKQMTYEETNDLYFNKKDIYFSDLFNLTCKKCSLFTVNDFKDVVAYWMIYYNNKIALLLNNQKNIFPCRYHNESIIQLSDKELPIELFFKNYSSAFYQINDPDINIKDITHYGLGLDIYTHATSPIRRINDVIIQIIYRKFNNIYFNNLENIIQSINTTENKIKKFHNKIDLLNKFSIWNKIYSDPKLCCFESLIVNFYENTKIELFNKEHGIFFNCFLIDINLIHLYEIIISNDNYLIILKNKKEIYRIKKYDYIKVNFLKNNNNILYPYNFYITNFTF